MANKKIFSIDGSNAKSFISNLASKIGKLRFVAHAESGRKLIDLPLIAVLIIGILLTFITVIAIIIALVMSVKINIESRDNDIILLDKQ